MENRANKYLKFISQTFTKTQETVTACQTAALMLVAISSNHLRVFLYYFCFVNRINRCQSHFNISS
jgi:hypothetical protein